MSDNTLKIEVIPNGFLYFEPMGSVSDGMQFIATAKRNSSQDAKVADWFEGTKKQGQSRDFKSVMHTALAACDAVNGGKDKWKVFRAIENYQKSHNLTITVQPKGQNKGNNQNKSQSLADRVKAVDWNQDNMVVANFRKLFGIVSDQDLEMKMPIRDAGYDARGIAQFEATYTYNGKQYLAKMSGKKKEARKAVIYKILADQFGIGEKEPEKEISKPKTADVEGFKEFIQDNLRDTDCRLWFRGVPEEYGIEPSWRYDPQKRVRRSDGGWAQVNSATLYLVEKGKQYRFEGIGRSSKDAENAAILKMAKEFCGLDVKAKIAEEKIEELQEDGGYEDLKYLKVLEEREDIYFERGTYYGGKYYVKTPYGDMAFFENDDAVDGIDSRLYLRTDRDVTPDVLKNIKVSKEEEAEIQRDINARIEEVTKQIKDYLINHKRELNYLMILGERSDVSYWSSLGEYAVNIDGGRTFNPGFEDVSYLRAYLPILRKQNPEISEILEAIKISEQEKEEITKDIDTRVNSVIEQVESEKAAEKAFDEFNNNVKAGNVKGVEDYFAQGGEVSNEFRDETLRDADSPEMIKLLIKNGALIETDNDASDADDMEEHSFLVDAIDEVRPDKVAAYLQMGADANFDASDYYYSDDQSVDLALKRIKDNEDNEAVAIITQMIEDARNGKPREEIRLEDYQKGAEKQEEAIEEKTSTRTESGRLLYSPEFETRDDVIKVSLASELDMYFVPSPDADGHISYEFCSKTQTEDEKKVQAWCEGVKNPRLDKDLLFHAARDAVLVGILGADFKQKKIATKNPDKPLKSMMQLSETQKAMFGDKTVADLESVAKFENNNQQGENKMTDKTSTIEFVGAMDNPHFMERHFNKEAMTIGSKPLPRASEDEMKTIMETMDEKALSLAQEKGADKVIYLSMELDHNIATDAVVPTDCVEQGKIFTITRDAGTKYEKDVRVVLISKEDMQKEAGTNLIHAIYGPDEGKFVNYTAFFGAMAERFPQELKENATPEQIAENEKCKEYWDKHVFLATPEEVGKIVKDLQQVAQNPELSADKKQQLTTVASAANMRINLFKNMGKKSPLTSGFHSEKADYEISVSQPKGNGNTRGGKGIGE